MGNSESSPAVEAPPGLPEHEGQIREISHLESAVLRKRIEAGVQFNMRILLRGQRGSGKTSLFRRFQGLGFGQTYAPTPEIQTATINWTFKKDDTSSVKVEVWDVVDKGFVPPGAVDMAVGKGKAITSTPSARSVTPGKHRFGALDAAAIDVYKSVQTVIFLINPFSPGALDYIRDELEDVPAGVSIVLLLNFRDKIGRAGMEPPATATATATAATAVPAKVPVPAGSGAEAAVLAATLAYVQQCKLDFEKCVAQCHTLDAVIELQREIQDAEGADRRAVHVLEVSTLNCFGLKELHRYLALPYLGLKMEALQVQIDRLAEERLACEKELRESVKRSVYADFASQFEARQAQGRAAAGTPGGVSQPAAAAAQVAGAEASPAPAASVAPAAAEPAVAAEKEETAAPTLRTAHRAPKVEEAKDPSSTLVFKKNAAEWEGFLDDDDDDDRRSAKQQQQQPTKGSRKSRGGLPMGQEVGGDDDPPAGAKARGGFTKVLKGKKKDKVVDKDKDKEGGARYEEEGAMPAPEKSGESETAPLPNPEPEPAPERDLEREVERQPELGQETELRSEERQEPEAGGESEAQHQNEPAIESEPEPEQVAEPEPHPTLAAVPAQPDDNTEVAATKEAEEDEKDVAEEEKEVAGENKGEEEEGKEEKEGGQEERKKEEEEEEEEEEPIMATVAPSPEEEFFAQDDDDCSVSPPSSVSTISPTRQSHGPLGTRRRAAPRAKDDSSDSDAVGGIGNRRYGAGNTSSSDGEEPRMAGGGRLGQLRASTASLASVTAQRGSINSLHSFQTSTSTQSLQDIDVLELMPSKALEGFFADGDSDSDSPAPSKAKPVSVPPLASVNNVSTTAKPPSSGGGGLSEAARAAIASAMNAMNDSEPPPPPRRAGRQDPHNKDDEGNSENGDDDDVDIDEIMRASRGADIRTDGGRHAEDAATGKPVRLHETKKEKDKAVRKKGGKGAVQGSDSDDDQVPARGGVVRKPKKNKKKQAGEN